MKKQSTKRLKTEDISQLPTAEATDDKPESLS